MTCGRPLHLHSTGRNPPSSANLLIITILMKMMMMIMVMVIMAPPLQGKAASTDCKREMVPRIGQRCIRQAQQLLNFCFNKLLKIRRRVGRLIFGSKNLIPVNSSTGPIFSMNQTILRKYVLEKQFGVKVGKGSEKYNMLLNPFCNLLRHSSTKERQVFEKL